MDTWKVYCYTNKVNKKQYIGITQRTLKDRAGSNGIFYQGYKFGKAIQKYGFNNFDAEILHDNLTHEEANALEQYYIEKYDTYYNGYNETLGGDGVLKTDYKLVKQLWDKGKSIQEISDEVHRCTRVIGSALETQGVSGIDRIKRQAGKYHVKQVYQYDFDGQYICSYNSIADASRAVNTPHGNIIKCLQGARQSAGGYQWSDYKYESIPPYKKRLGNIKKIYKYDLSGKLLKWWPSVADCAREEHFNSVSLSQAARENKTHNGFIWSYEKNI